MRYLGCLRIRIYPPITSDGVVGRDDTKSYVLGSSRFLRFAQPRVGSRHFRNVAGHTKQEPIGANMNLRRWAANPAAVCLLGHETFYDASTSSHSDHCDNHFCCLGFVKITV